MNVGTLFYISVILFIVGFGTYAVVDSLSDETLARESKAQEYRNTVHYYRDGKTGICFAYLSRHRQFGLATVECTQKVRDQIELEKK